MSQDKFIRVHVQMIPVEREDITVHVQLIPEERKDITMWVTVHSDEETRKSILAEREMIREQMNRTA